jgi:fibronectin type 3 domain-containing protein
MKQFITQMVLFFRHEMQSRQCRSSEADCLAPLETDRTLGSAIQKSTFIFSYLFILILIMLLVSCADYDMLDEKPGAVSLAVSDVQDSSVTLSWTQSTDENFKNYRIYYDTNNNLSRFGDSILFAAQTTATIKTLAPATAYYFAVFVTNQAAKSSMSNIASAVTWLQFQPQQWLGDSAVLLKWGRPRGVSVTGYRLYSDTTASVDSLDTLEAQPASGDTAFYLSYLPYGITEYLKVYAMGNSGTLTGSTTAQVKGWWFLQYAPVQVSDTSVRLSWKQAGSSVQQYAVFGSTSSPADTTKTACGTFSASDTSGTVTGLVKGTRYFFKVYAKGTSGYIAWTQEMADSLQ